MVKPGMKPLEEALSAVMDGRAAPGDWARVEAAWDADPGVRERWASWHAVGDGLRAPDLAPLHREPAALLEALRQAAPALAAPAPVQGPGWWAPVAVAASFVMAAVGLGAWRPAADSAMQAVAVPISTSPAQGLVGLSFAQVAASPTLAPDAAQAPSVPLLDVPDLAASMPRP